MSALALGADPESSYAASRVRSISSATISPELASDVLSIVPVISDLTKALDTEVLLRRTGRLVDEDENTPLMGKVEIGFCTLRIKRLSIIEQRRGVINSISTTTTKSFERSR